MDTFDNWFLLYTVLVLEMHFPVLEALAVCGQPIFKQGDRILLKRNYREHCLWGPSSTIRTFLNDLPKAIIWKKQALYDRSDGPAVECVEAFTLHVDVLGIPRSFSAKPGSKFWFKQGEFHCLTGPAIEHLKGSKQWWVDGHCTRTYDKKGMQGLEMHYEDAPTGDTLTPWYPFQPHRLDAPAVIDSYGGERWYHHGKLHRIDGPAFRNSNGHTEWWLNGVKVTKKSARRMVAYMSAKRQKIDERP